MSTIELHSIRDVWSHGTRFQVRRVGTTIHANRDTRWTDSTDPYTRRKDIAGSEVISLNGRYLAKVRRGQLKRWLQYYGLKTLQK